MDTSELFDDNSDLLLNPQCFFFFFIFFFYIFAKN